MEAKFDREVDRWGGLYTKKARQWAFLPQAAARRVAERKKVCLDWLQGQNVIDIGCNGGYYGLEIAKTRNWFGLDISREMLQTGKIRFTRAGLRGQFVNGNILAIPIKDQSFDTAICIGVINYFTIDKVKNILADIDRILKPGGQFIFTNLRLDIFTWLRSRLPRIFPRPLRLPGPLYPHPANKINSLLKKNGFIINQTKRLRKYKIFPYITIQETIKS